MRSPLPHSVTMHEEPVAATRKAPEVSKLCVGVIASSVYAEGNAAALLEAGHCLYLFGCYLMQRRAHEESEGQTRGILNDILHNAGINEEYVLFFYNTHFVPRVVPLRVFRYLVQCSPHFTDDASPAALNQPCTASDEP